VILNAAGICQDCGRKHLSPEDPKYDNIKNIPELQCHHIEPLGSGGADTIANCVALCPNCHRKRHIILNEDLE
jgi:5-methylcytosine-specific restriction protein A